MLGVLNCEGGKHDFGKLWMGRHGTISPKTIDFCGPSAFAGTSTATGPPKILAIHGQ
jgi:hypothetical protein